MGTDDLSQVAALSRAEGWNQTDADWRFLITNPGNVSVVAVTGDKIIGTAVATVHSNHLAWIGMVLVNKENRGCGIGKMLMVYIIDHLEHISSIKLDATPAGQPLYAKLGFREECQILRMLNQNYTINPDPRPEYIAEPLREESFHEILKLDKRISGIERRELLTYLFRNYPEKAFLISRDGKPEGYIMGRKGIRYNYLGPLCSLTEESARSLFLSAANPLAGTPVAVDIPGERPEFKKWLESSGFEYQRSFTRMYLKSLSDSGESRHQYLISGPEYC